MFIADAKLLARVSAHLPRVIVFDPHSASAKLLSELLKEMGAKQVTCASRTVKGLDLIAHVQPALICMDYMGEDFDGPDLIKRMRRSNSEARKTPVIMVTGEATVESIKAARDSGAHEFLRKPYTARDLFRRVENVVMNPRMWIEAQMYVGPDRRRFNSGEFVGAKKREADAATARDLAEAEAATGRLQAAG